MNNFYYTTVAGGAPTPLAATIDAVDAWITTQGSNYAQCLSNEVNSLTVRGQIIQPTGGPVPTRYMFYEAICTPEEGAVAGNSLPSTSTAVVRKRTTLSGRRYRGRVYVPGVPVAWEEDSVLSAIGQSTLLDGIGEILVTPLVGGVVQWEPIVTNAPSFTRQTIINAAAVDPVLRVQRRREVGVGE